MRTADGTVAVDARLVSAASDTVVSRNIHRKSQCVTTVVPKLAAAPQAAYEVIQPRPPDYGYTDSLPLGSGCLDLPRIDTPEEINISRSPDSLQTEISVTPTEMAGGSPPVNIGCRCMPPGCCRVRYSSSICPIWPTVV